MVKCVSEVNEDICSINIHQPSMRIEPSDKRVFHFNLKGTNFNFSYMALSQPFRLSTNQAYVPRGSIIGDEDGLYPFWIHQLGWEDPNFRGDGRRVLGVRH